MKRRNSGWENIGRIQSSTYIQMYCDEELIRVDVIDGEDYRILSIRLIN